MWRFCEGWNPDRIPMAAAFYEVTDMDLLIDLLIALRDRLRQQRNSNG